MDEKKLILKIQSGDMNAFAELFEIYKNEAYKYSYLITGKEDLSEDIVQEAFVQCYTNIKNLKNIEQFKSWFFKILTRLAWKYSNKEKKAVPVDDIFEKADSNKLDEYVNEYIRKEQSDMLHSEIEKLDVKQKTVIILYYFNELTIKEIAHVMGCFEGTVKSRLHSARRKLKKNLMRSDEYGHGIVKECEVR
ncbi:RNA polymerase sigma factor [uncultured Clostridium sp.]|uniref:RNA polymerase sigma factor n=1 Tax=uncultured Clostridium sp. TaxID=59620 RepID=UPI0025DEEACE|nr:RNA polymerase sigma factor [uncultured Clostridium sp.]